MPDSFTLCGGLGHVTGEGALLDPAQYFLVARFYSLVQYPDTRVFQLFQFVDGLLQNRLGVGIHADPLDPAALFVDIADYLEKGGGGEDEHIAVRQKDFVKPVAGRFVDIALYRGHVLYAELLALVGAAERAHVVRASHGYLNDHAVCLAGRPYNVSYIVHDIYLLLSCRN